MRRVSCLIALIVCLAFGLSGCAPLVSDDDGTLSIYATFYPVYALTEALTRNIPDIELYCLVQPQDGCLRAYQLSDWDVRLLAASADAVMAGGRGLESFESTLFNWGEGGPAVSAVLYNLELYNRSTSHARDEDSHLDGPNPHLYMSIDGARQMIGAIAAALMTLDPGYSEAYIANETEANAALDALSDEIAEITSGLSGEKVILMNEALIYVAQDYGLEVAEWIDRESGTMYYDAELQDCLDKLDESGARVVLIERQAPVALAQALEDAGYAVARIDILSTHREGEGFEAYCRAQLENAKAVKSAFEALKIDQEDAN